jgi:DNA polymerase Pol2
VLKFVRNVLRTALKTTTYELDAVAEELLGEKKVDVDIENLAEAWDTGNGLDKFCEYNLQDAKITYELCIKLFPNMVELIKLIGLPLVDINRMGLSQLVEWFLMKRAQEFNEVAPNKPKFSAVEARRSERYEGAFVYEPKAGLYKDLVVFDFRSLYPTIIASHNISAGTLNCDCCKDTEFAPVEGRKFYFCKKKKGFIPSVIKDLITRRVRVKEIMKEGKGDNALLYARQMSLKLLANSFYGYLGFFGARWYSVESAMSVTAYARHYITTTIDKVKKAGFNVIYSDTDSVFLTLNNKTIKDAKDFVAEENKNLPELMELEYEGSYPAGIFVSVKAQEVGAKKKYALLSDKGKIIIKGFETVRRNWSAVAKDLQKKVLGLILSDRAEEAVSHVRGIIDDLHKHLIPLHDVTISTQLTKPIESYENVSPHVFVAQRMKNKGIPVGPGSIIEFVITKGKGKIRDKAKLISECSEKDYDSEYYINNQIIPAVGRILEVLGYSEDDLINKGSQKTLGHF